MKSKLHFNSKTVLKHKFGTEIRGYNAHEVDEFLDKVLVDYQQYEQLTTSQEKTIDENNGLISTLQKDNALLDRKIKNLLQQIEATEEKDPNAAIQRLKREFSEIE